LAPLEDRQTRKNTLNRVLGFQMGESLHRYNIRLLNTFSSDVSYSFYLILWVFPGVYKNYQERYAIMLWQGKVV